MRLHLNSKRSQVEKLQRLARLVLDAQQLEGLALILQQFLGEKPMSFEARWLLRRVQIDQYEAAAGNFRILKERWQKLQMPMLHAKAQKALEESPKKALELAEDILAINPYDEAGNLVIARAAKALGVPKLAVLALETICARKDDHAPYLIQLGEAYMANHDFADAREAFNEAIELEPGSVAARDGLERIEVAEANYHPSDWKEADEEAQEVDGRQAPTILNPKPMRYEFEGLLDPPEEGWAPASELCGILEPIEDNAAFASATIPQWIEWINGGLGATLAELEKAAAENPEDGFSHIRLGCLQAAFLRLPEARHSFDVATRNGFSTPVIYAMSTICLIHEDILVRPVPGPTRADFAWIV